MAWGIFEHCRHHLGHFCIIIGSIAEPHLYEGKGEGAMLPDFQNLFAHELPAKDSHPNLCQRQRRHILFLRRIYHTPKQPPRSRVENSLWRETMFGALKFKPRGCPSSYRQAWQVTVAMLTFSQSIHLFVVLLLAADPRDINTLTV